jgi:predicted negative regulator of RcsB-dependent stress response
VSTTKLTRKEILAEDPVHESMVRIIEALRTNGKMIAVIAAGVALAALGIYFGLDFLEKRDLQAQQQLARAMEFYNGRIDAAAPDDPYGKSVDPVFRNESAKYEAAAREFSTVISKYGSSKLGVIARYYLGMSQLQLDKKDEAVRSLESVSNNTKDRTVAYLAKKVLARTYIDSGNYKGGQALLEGMIKDPQCDLPREDMKVELSRALIGQGKRDDALKLLREARDEAGRSMLQSMIVQELTRLEAGSGPKTGTSRP